MLQCVLASGGAPWPEDNAVSGAAVWKSLGSPVLDHCQQDTVCALMCLVCFHRQQGHQKKTQTCNFLLLYGSDLETVARARNPSQLPRKTKTNAVVRVTAPGVIPMCVKGPLRGSRSQLCGRSVTSYQSVGNNSKKKKKISLKKV